jgi:protein-tyrosine phosphatase
MAKIVFEDALKKEGLADQVRVSSAGTGPWYAGGPADARAAATLRSAGFDDGHVAAQLGDEHLSADLLVALDSGHGAVLRRLVEPERVAMLRSFDPDARGALDVPDPFGGRQQDFDVALGMVRAAVPGLLDWVRARL